MIKEKTVYVLKDTHLPEPKIKGFVYSKNKRIRKKQIKKRFPFVLCRIVGDMIETQLISALIKE